LQKHALVVSITPKHTLTLFVLQFSTGMAFLLEGLKGGVGDSGTVHAGGMHEIVFRKIKGKF